MKAQDKEDLIRIMSYHETRASRDIQFLMRVAFEAGKSGKHKNYDAYMSDIKRMLDL